eukprot:194693-Hanusia_phi.AAC.1
MLLAVYGCLRFRLLKRFIEQHQRALTWQADRQGPPIAGQTSCIADGRDLSAIVVLSAVLTRLRAVHLLKVTVLSPSSVLTERLEPGVDQHVVSVVPVAPLEPDHSVGPVLVQHPRPSIPQRPTPSSELVDVSQRAHHLLPDDVLRKSPADPPLRRAVPPAWLRPLGAHEAHRQAHGGHHGRVPHASCRQRLGISSPAEAVLVHGIAVLAPDLLVVFIVSAAISAPALIVRAEEVLDRLRRRAEPVVHAKGRPQLRDVPTARPVTSAMVASSQGPVLLDDVEVARVDPEGIEAALVDGPGVLGRDLGDEDLAGKELMAAMRKLLRHVRRDVKGRVEPEAVTVALVQPYQTAGRQQVDHLRLPPGVSATPLRVRSTLVVDSSVVVLAPSVEVPEDVPLHRGMMQHHIDDHCDPLLVRSIDKVTEVVGATVRGMSGQQLPRVVSPASVMRRVELSDGHDFDCREAQVGKMVQLGLSCFKRPLLCERANVHLVDDQLVPGRRLPVALPLVLGAVLDTDAPKRITRLDASSVRIASINLSPVARCEHYPITIPR